jgi:CheY-like chemotaxis protein
VRHILIVDDEPEVRALLRRVLEDSRYACSEATDAGSATKLVAGREVDLVLLNLELPGGATREILASLAGMDAPPPTVGMGLHGQYEAFVSGVEGGIAGFVARPFHMSRLLETCAGAIESAQRAARERAAAGSSDDPEADAEDRRSGERRPLLVAAHLLGRDGSPLALGELLDVSAEGVKLALIVPYEVGQELQVSLEPSVAGRFLEFTGRVRWRESTGTGFAHGLEFSTVADDAKLELERLVRQRDED